MKMQLIRLLLFMPIFVNCSSGQQVIGSECSQETAVQVANRQYKRSRHKLENYIVEVKEDSLRYNIEYKLKEPARYGGGAEFTISKQDCSVVDQKLYQ